MLATYGYGDMIVEVIPTTLMLSVSGFQFVGFRYYVVEADGELLSNINEVYCIFDFRRTTRLVLPVPTWK
jgi:hypothetical protein